MHDTSEPSQTPPLTIWRILFCLLFGSLVLALCFLLINQFKLLALPVDFLLCFGFYKAMAAAWDDRQHNQPWPWYKLPIGWVVVCWQLLQRFASSKTTSRAVGCLAMVGMTLLSIVLLLISFCCAAALTTLVFR